MLLPSGKAGRLRLEQLEPRDVPSRPLPCPVIFAGTGAGAPAAIRAFAAETGDPLFGRPAFDRFAGGVHVAAADFTRDGFPDAVIAPGPGGGPHVRVLDGKTGEQISGPVGSFFAYDPAFLGGVRVAAADVDGDEIPDVVTAAGAGGGPHVKVFSGATGAQLHSLFALEPGFRGGASVAAADFTGDGRAEVVVGAGAGGGPRVRVLDLTTGHPVGGPRGDFFALDPLGRSGVAVATDGLAGDVNADGVPDLVAGSGPGGPARVVVYSGKGGDVLADFRPFGDDLVSGVRVATAFVDDDPFADVVAGTGPGVAATVRVFSGKTFAQLPGRVGEFRPFGDGELGGVFVGASNDPPSYAKPESAADAYAISHDTTLSAGGQTGLAGLLGNDRDRDGDTLTARLLGPADGKPAPLGAVTLAADGSFTYTPPAKFVGEDTFWYAAKDEVVEGDPVPVAVSVVQHNPVALSGSSTYMGWQPHAGKVGLHDGDGDVVTVTLVDPPVAGDLVLNADGTFVYTPYDPPALADRFTYTVADPLEPGPLGVWHLYGIVTMPVVPAAMGGAVWFPHDRTKAGEVVISPNGLPCAEGCDPVYAILDATTQNGVLSLDEVTHQYTYTPNKGYVGTDQFVYHAKTGEYVSPPAPWALTVVERRPVARADAFVTGQKTAITKSLAVNDADGDGDVLTWQVVQGPNEATQGKLTSFDAKTGTFTFQPNDTFTGVAKFTYKVWDGLAWTADTSAYLSVYEAPGASIGDYVWLDEDEDGYQDPTEKGIAGVAVGLLQYDYATGTYLGTGGTATNSAGWYSFNNLYSGKYKVQFVNPDTGRYSFTHPDKAGVSDESDSDALPDNTAHLSGTTDAIPLGLWELRMKEDCGLRDAVDIDTDINRNGGVEDEGVDEDNEETDGTVVIRNAENVYEVTMFSPAIQALFPGLHPDVIDPERARRREVVLRNRTNNNPVHVTRSSPNVMLYELSYGGSEVAFTNNTVTLAPNKSYWLQGGPTASTTKLGDWLEVRPAAGAPAQDKVAITVLWVGLEARMATTDTLSPNPVFDGESGDRRAIDDVWQTKRTSIIAMGTDSLGVRRSQSEYLNSRQMDGAVPKRVKGAAPVEFLGSIDPKDLAFPPFPLPDRKLDHTDGNQFNRGQGAGSNGGYKASVPFGFVFRRLVSEKTYRQSWAGGTMDMTGKENYGDDSGRHAQDISPSPNAGGTKLQISDYDDPFGSIRFDEAKKNFMHRRINFPTEHVVFHYTIIDQKPIPERSSKKIPWSVSIDIGTNYTNEATFLLKAPNSGTERNFVQTGTLASLDLTLPLTTITGVTTANGKIPNNAFVELTVTGTNLIGEYRLERTDDKSKLKKAERVKVKEDHPDEHFPWSEAKESKAMFHLPAADFPDGTKVKLVIKTVNGEESSGELEVE